MLLSGRLPEEMCDRWRTLRVKDFVSFVSPEKYLRAWNMEAMGDADGILEHVFPHLGINVDAIRSSTGMEGTFNVCDFTRKTNEAIPHTRVDRDLLVAGISLPIFMPPVRKDGTLYLDSVWIQDANLLEAVRRGANELWVLWCIGNTPTLPARRVPPVRPHDRAERQRRPLRAAGAVQELNARILAGEHVPGHTAAHRGPPHQARAPAAAGSGLLRGPRHRRAPSSTRATRTPAATSAVGGRQGLPLTPEITQMN